MTKTTRATRPDADPSEYVRSIEELRERARAALRGRTSTLAAVARHEIPIGSALRFGPGDAVDVRLVGMDRDVEIRALADGFTVDGVPSDPRSLDAGRYTLRLSHQNYPAVVVLDSQSSRLREEVELRWFPVDASLRLRSRLELARQVKYVASTASGHRPAEHVGWIDVVIGDVPVRLLATRLLEPGFAPDHLDVYFRDATTGQGSYEVGRYVAVERDGEEVVVDFNLAYNPSCALSPYYNCPIPPEENGLTVPVRAGEMSPFIGKSH